MNTTLSILKPATLQQHPGLLPAHGIPILPRHSLQPHSNFMHGSTTLMIAIHPTPHINQQDPGQTVQQTAPNRGVCMVPASIVVVMWCSKMKTRNVAGVSYASQNIPSLSFCNFDRCFDSVFWRIDSTRSSSNMIKKKYLTYLKEQMMSNNTLDMPTISCRWLMPHSKTTLNVRISSTSNKQSVGRQQERRQEGKQEKNVRTKWMA